MVVVSALPLLVGRVICTVGCMTMPGMADFKSSAAQSQYLQRYERSKQQVCNQENLRESQFLGRLLPFRVAELCSLLVGMVNKPLLNQGDVGAMPCCEESGSVGTISESIVLGGRVESLSPWDVRSSVNTGELIVG